MLIRIRNLKNKRDGQAIVLAALGMLILAIGVLATVNLGHAIHERIKLQDTADAAAYSLAALEARAFNFFAFTNRAQVSHYITAMSFQTFLVMVWFIEMVLGTLHDIVSDIKAICCALCPFTAGITCVIAKIAGTVQKILAKIHKIYKKFAKIADKILGNVVYIIPMVNKYGVHTTQQMMKKLVQLNALASGRKIVVANDPDVDPGVWDLIAMGVNITEFNRSFDSSSSKLPKPNASGEAKAAQRVMAEIVNATRWPDFITNRKLSNILSAIPFLGPVVGKLMKYAPIILEPTGQTKLTSHIKKCGWFASGCRCGGSTTKSRFGTQFDWSALPTGNVLVGDQVMEFKINIIGIEQWDVPIAKDYVSVWASVNKKGMHCAHANKCMQTLVCGNVCATWPKCVKDWKNHKWEGIEPYIKFDPNSDPSNNFNQPSTFSLLNKKPEKLGGQAYVQKFNLTVGNRTEEIDTNIGIKPLAPMKMFKGLNAWSRGMAYYHRPSYKSGESNWREHPNFFNPFWRAKLAPIGERVNQWVSKLGISGQFANYFTRELITH